MRSGKNFHISDDDRDGLCQTLCTGGVRGGSSAAARLMSQGLSIHNLYFDVLKPVAERFDDFWNEDRVTFLEVHVAMVRLEQIVKEYACPKPTIDGLPKRQAFFATVPGDEHTAGLRMAANIQRSKGWQIRLITHLSHAKLLSEIEHSPTTILGLSIGSKNSMHQLYNLVRSVRVSRPDVRILVSGSLVAVDEHPIRLLGVDASAKSFEEAEQMLDDLVEQTT
ncbi:B12-binding domain-containing protein [uncultured Litoreibacter sp.]|uniref:cobalamin B12-binding domain-containing protein n=1 Tax=uncultured Litoreibacter sp. TaxID=1392394 RepID=UPI0026161DA5|nr:cobalamin B12-binding domain-containing protein [uncultured Litoreibacter sp.]